MFLLQEIQEITIVFFVSGSRPQANDCTRDSFARVAIYETRCIIAMAAVIFVSVDNEAAAQDVRAVSAKFNHGVSKRAFDVAMRVGFEIPEITHMSLTRINVAVIFTIGIKMRAHGFTSLRDVAGFMDVESVAVILL